MSTTSISTLPAVASHLREELKKKKFVLLYAHNGTGKTRLSVEFKNAGKKRVRSQLTTSKGDVLVNSAGAVLEPETAQRDTL